MRVLRSEYIKQQNVTAAQIEEDSKQREIQNAISSILYNADEDKVLAGPSTNDTRRKSKRAQNKANAEERESEARAQEESNDVPKATPTELAAKWMLRKRNVEIYVHGINENTPKFDLVVQFSDVQTSNEYLRLFRSSEGQLWYRTPRLRVKDARWYFNCNFCQRRLRTAKGLRYHLNIHLKLYPFECPVCKRRFHASSCGRRHQKKVHGMS